MFRLKEELPLNNLYSKEVRIMLNLLNEIYRETDGLTVETISLKTAISAKTVYKYIRDLNELSMETYNKKSIELSSHNNHYYFYGDKIEFLTLRYLILEKCEALQLIFELIPSSSVNIYNFCSRFFISESTLKNNIRRINNIFEFLNLRLITRKNEIYLIGDEAIIRYCFSSILWRTYNGLIWPYNNLLNQSKLQNLKQILYKNPKARISLGKQDMFMTQLAISILRLNSSHALSNNELPSYTKKLTSNFIHLEEFKITLKEQYFFPDLEVDFILLNLYLSPEQAGLVNRNEFTLNVLKNHSPLIYNSSIQFIDFIQKKHTEWDPNSKNGRLFISAVLSAHIVTDLYKQASFNMQDLNLIYYASTEFPSLIPSITQIAQSLNPNLPEDILRAFSFHLTKVYLLSFSPRDFEPEINVLLVSDSPAYVERGIIYRIKSILKYKYNLVISTDPSAFTSIDLVIATGLYTDIPQYPPIIFVFPQILNRDSQTIMEACEKIYRDKLNT